jgi:hypothetical protein
LRPVWEDRAVACLDDFDGPELDRLFAIDRIRVREL